MLERKYPRFRLPLSALPSPPVPEAAGTPAAFAPLTRDCDQWVGCEMYSSTKRWIVGMSVGLLSEGSSIVVLGSAALASVEGVELA